jgi:hypothetical protein
MLSGAKKIFDFPDGSSCEKYLDTMLQGIKYYTNANE